MKNRGKEKKINLIDDIPGIKKIGRPSSYTPEIGVKLIKLFEDHFFIAIVAAKADIYRHHIYDWINASEELSIAVTHAQDMWITNEMQGLIKDAKDKKTKDWRAREYRLSIAKREFSAKKWPREEARDAQSLKLSIIINQKDLSTSKVEAMKLIGSSSTAETVSLELFKPKEEKKK